MRRLRKALLILGAATLSLVLAAGGWYLTRTVAIPDAGGASEYDVDVAADVSAAVVQSASQRLTELRREAPHPAVSAAVAIGGRVVWCEAQGYADIASGRRATVSTPFPIGSVSKPLTATATMLLVEQGRIELDADVRRYVPAFPEKSHPMTVRQLLSHQAGVRHYRFVWDPPAFSEMSWNVAYASVGDSLALFAEDPLAFPPDTSFQYSTYGYTLVSAAVEAAAGRPFLEHMDAALFSPLSMPATRADDPAQPPANRSTDYISAPGGRVLPSPPSNSSNKWAGGGFLSTPRDLARFGAALLDGEIVSDASRDLLFEPRQTLDGTVNEQSYGLGWRVGRMSSPTQPDELIRIVHHGGTSIGAQSVLLLLPDSGVVVAIAANSYTGGSGAVLQAAAAIAREFLEAATTRHRKGS